MSTAAEQAGNVHQPDQSVVAAPVNKAQFAMLMFIAAEVMIFAGLISVYLILRAGSEVWPPPGQPYLPVAVTAVNTVVLLASGFSMRRALRSLRNAGKRVTNWLAVTAALGIVFLLIQGSEWLRLVKYGLTFVSSVYGGTFYATIGFHGLHVLGATVALTYVLRKSKRGSYTHSNRTGLELCGMYWYFVVAIWPVLYFLVYLS